MNILSVLFYIFIPIVIFILGVILDKFVKNKKTSRLIQIIIFSLFLSCIIGLRSTSVGNDTSSYYSSYESLRGISLSDAFRMAHFEKGYLFVTYIFSNMRIPFILFNFLVSLLLSLSLVCSCFLLSKYPALSISIYICSGCFTLNMSSVRQTLAMALCFISIVILCLVKDKKLFFKIISLIPWGLAIFIHKSSALFIIAFLCMLIKPKKWHSVIYFALISLLIILFMPSISTQILFSNIKATETYSFFPPRASLSFSGTALMLYLLLIAYFIFYTIKNLSFNMTLDKVPFIRKMNNVVVLNKSKYFNDQIVLGMVFFQYFMYLGEQSISLLARGGLYGGLGLCIFVPNLINKISKKEKTNFVFLGGILMFFIAYFAFATLKDNYLGLIPYGIF